MTDDPFAQFSRKKAADNQAMVEKDADRQQRKNEGFDHYIINHNKIIEMINVCNPEAVVWRLYDMGFHGNMKYNRSHIKREIRRVIVTEQHEIWADSSSLAAFDTDLAVEMNRLVSADYLENWKLGLPLHQRAAIMGSPRVCITEIKWQLVLWETKEMIRADKWDSVPYGPVISLLPDQVTIAGKPVLPLNTQNLTRQLAAVTKEIMRIKEDREEKESKKAKD